MASGREIPSLEDEVKALEDAGLRERIRERLAKRLMSARWDTPTVKAVWDDLSPGQKEQMFAEVDALLDELERLSIDEFLDVLTSTSS